MNHYIIWFNLKDNIKANSFSQDLINYLNALKDRNLIIDYKIMRRKLGFGPSELGEFMVDLICKDLGQLDKAFHTVIEGISHNNDLEMLHKKVNTKVIDFKSALYRDFPDENT